MKKVYKLSIKERKVQREANYRHEIKYPGRIKANMRRRVLSGRAKDACRKSLYKITPEKYRELIKKQKGKCLICKKLFPTNKNPSVDHDKKCCPSGKSCGKCIRGILCGACNAGIGLLKENVKILKSAILYLGGSL